MTPEQMVSALDKTLAKHDIWTAVIALSSVIVGMGITLLFGYVKKRLENTASISDAWELTSETEAAKAPYSVRLEKVKAILGHRSHFNKIRYEREIEVYRKLWPTLVDLKDIAQQLRPFFEVTFGHQTDDARKSLKVNLFMERQLDAYKIVNKERPFFPPEIWVQLNALLKTTQDEFVNFNFIDQSGLEKEEALRQIQKAEENQQQITEQIDRICEAIRVRLDKFDDFTN